MNNLELYETLAQSYREYDTNPETKALGLAYIDQFHARYGKESPEVQQKWEEFLNTPAGEREKDYLDDAGCFLALMDTMKNLWTETYQVEVEKAIQTDPDLQKPEPYKLPHKGKILKNILRTAQSIVFFSASIFICLLVLSLIGFDKIQQGIFISFISLIFSSAGWVVARWFWKKKYAHHLAKSNQAVEKYTLLWQAKYGTVPVVTEHKTLIPSPPFSWAKNGEDIKKYAQVSEYLKTRFLHPYDESLPPPELTLPEIDKTKLPVESLNVLKQHFLDTLN